MWPWYLCILLLLLLLITLLCFLLLRKKGAMYNKIYAKFMSRVSKSMAKSKTVNEIKSGLFGSMQSHKRIVEIGAGTGANMKFYPEQCSVTCIEPKVEFKKYINEVQSKSTHLESVEFVQGYGEHLSDLIEADSVDYVVCTFVLCSVEDVNVVASQVKKILKQDGKFFFLEHVHAPKQHRIACWYQDMITPITRVVADNCHFNRECWTSIESAGFSSVQYQRRELKNALLFSPLRFLCVGTATK